MIPKDRQLNVEPKGEPHFSAEENADLMRHAPEVEPMTSETLEEMYHEHIKGERHKEVHGDWPGKQPKPF